MASEPISGADLLPLEMKSVSMDSELKETAADGKAVDEKGESEREYRPLLKSESMISSSSINGEEKARSSPSSSLHDHHTSPGHPDNHPDLEKKYAAFFRSDSYGPMGRGDISLKEKLFLAMALLTLVPLRLFLGLAIVCSYYLICRSLTLFSIPNNILLDRDRDRGPEEQRQEDYAHMLGWRRSLIVRSGRFFSRSLLFVFGFYSIPLRYNYQSPPRHVSHKHIVEYETINLSEGAVRPGAIISNHVSYLDILYHMSASFPSFVAKRSVAKLPLVGLISKCLGCVFVQRESKTSDFKGVSGAVTERVQAAHEDKHAPMMMLFPEGTTTNGGFLLPFKTGAFLSKAPVLPVILRYPYKRFSPAWDSISGVRHLIFLLCQFVNYMEVIRLPVYYPSEQEREDPKLYANNVRKLMASEGKLILSDIGLPEKRIYHAALNGLFSRS